MTRGRFRRCLRFGVGYSREAEQLRLGDYNIDVGVQLPLLGLDASIRLMYKDDMSTNAWQPVGFYTVDPLKSRNRLSTYRLVYNTERTQAEMVVEATKAWYEYMRETYLGKPIPEYGLLVSIGPTDKDSTP